jgi:signal transduction histidine kinase
MHQKERSIRTYLCRTTALALKRNTAVRFSAFFSGSKKNYPGTGIGLAIAKKIVDNHNGFIKAISAPGKGAKFVILLPKN